MTDIETNREKNLETEMNRRNFIQKTSAVAGVLSLGIVLPGTAKFGSAREKSVGMNSFDPNAWISISSEGMTFVLDKAEMGQNVYTSLPVILSEELEVDPNSLRVILAPVDPAYNHPDYGSQITGGSTSVPSSWTPLRMAGATAREMLKTAAAKQWGVEVSTVIAENGSVYNSDKSKVASYQDLAEAASKLPVPDASSIKLKKPSEYKLIGKFRRRRDSRMKTVGAATFGIDTLPNSEVVASVIHCPTFGGTATKIDATAAKSVPGFVDAVIITDGVAVVCEKFWQVLKAKALVKVTWDRGELAGLDDKAIAKMLQDGLKEDGAEITKKKEAESAIKKSKNRIVADYNLPYLAHAAMEPIACSAEIKDGECHVWTPTQAPTLCRYFASKGSGISADNTFIHTVLAGGGFGRKGYARDTLEVVEIAAKLKKSVKLIWTREDDTKHDAYRPVSAHKLWASLDSDGNLEAWSHKIASPAILGQLLPTFVASGLPQFLPDGFKTFVGSTGQTVLNWIGKDDSSIEGAKELPYEIPNQLVTYELVDPKVPVGFWRSVGNSTNGFVTESFVDEIAHKAKKDPVEFRRKMMEKGSRDLAVLDLATKNAGWGKPLPKNHFHGVAVHKSFGTYVAEVVEIYLDGSLDTLKVIKVTAAVDCGIVIDPDTVKAQIEGGIIFGLTAALYGKISIKDGGVQQSNFHDYPIARMNEIPEINVLVVQNEHKPMGVGEPGVPPIAPALTNAIFAGNGNRIRNLPIKS